MNEAAFAGRIERLERSVRRWRLAAFVFAVLFLCSLATGGTLVAMLMMQERDARQQADIARQDAEEARRRLQHELEAARKQP